MKLNKYFAIAALATAAMTASAQQFNYSSYFIDGNVYRHQLNPAFGNDSTRYVGFPVLANMGVGMMGNLGVKGVFYNVNGKTTTFLNPAVSAAEVMKNIHSTNRLGAGVNLSILSGGFQAWGGYNTVEINARAQANAKVPGTLFRMLKEGIQNQTYDITDVRMTATAYSEIAFGHSRQITPQWRVGAKVKFLIGIGDIDARFEDARLTLGEDSWDIVSNATVNASVKGMKYKMKVNENTGHHYVNGVDYDSFGLNGFGMGFDLGAEYKLNQDWTFSAALLDLGFISWNENQRASTNGTKQFQSSIYTFSANDDAPNSFDNEWDNMRDDLSALYELDNCGNTGSRTTALQATLNLAAEYVFPYYRPLTFGLINSTRIAGAYSWTQFRLSANVAPVKIFSGGINMAVGTYGVDFGWVANLHCPGFNLFIGMDRTLGKLAKQGIPLSSNGSFNFGINFRF